MTINQELARAFWDRATAQEMKGKARDRAALEFFLGAAAALNERKAAQQQVMFAASMIAVRGFKFVQECAK